MQVRQLPARQPKSMATSFSSAKSRIESDSASHLQVLPDLAKTTSMLSAAAAAAAFSSGALAGAAFLTVAGPKASKWMSFSGTPHSMRAGTIVFIIGGGPHM